TRQCVIYCLSLSTSLPPHPALHSFPTRRSSDLLPARVHAVDPVAFQAFAPAIEHRPGDPQFAAHRADVALHLRALDDAQAHPVYALVEGHRSVLPQWFPWPGTHSGKDRAERPSRSFTGSVNTITSPDRLGGCCAGADQG